MTTASEGVLDFLIDQGQFTDPALGKGLEQESRAAETAIEGWLGLASGSLYLMEKETLNAWFSE